MKPDAPKDAHRILIEEGPLIDEALKSAVHEALLRHQRLGQQVVIYRDGKTEWVYPAELGIVDS